jgi:hypothetical protein
MDCEEGRKEGGAGRKGRKDRRKEGWKEGRKERKVASSYRDGMMRKAF